MDFKALNVDEDWSAQLPGHSFDVVIANNSLHLASDLNHAIRGVASVLVPNGILLAVTSTQSPLWLQVLYTAQKSYVPLTSAAYAEALKANGFHSINSQVTNESPFDFISAQSSALTLSSSFTVPTTAAPTVFDAHVAGNDLSKLLTLSQSTYDSKDAMEYWVLTSNGEDIEGSFTLGGP